SGRTRRPSRPPRPRADASEQVAQPRDQRRICRRHRVLAELVRLHPCDCLVFTRRHKTLPAPAQEQWHEQMKRFVSMAGKNKRSQTAYLDLNSELFLQFSDEGGLRGFTLVNLTAREFP